MTFLDGQKFGRLIPICRVGSPNKWLCKCDCGNEPIIAGRYNGNIIPLRRAIESSGSNISPETARRRLKRGLSFEEAIGCGSLK